MLISVTTIGDLIDGAAAARPDATAVVFPDDRATFAELADASTRWARALHGLGVGPRDHVGVLMGNRMAYVVALLAIAKLGAVAAPINGRFKVHELSHVVSHGDLVALLVAAEPEGTDFPALVRELPADATPGLRHVIDLGDETQRDAFEAGADAVAEDAVRTLQARVRVRDIALLMYTSGTTARPKGCLLTHEALVRQARAVATTRFELTDADAFWDPLPLFHCGGIVPMLGCLGAGARYVHAGHFDAATALRMMAEERCTVAYPAFETIWNAVLNHPDFDATDLSRLRLIQNIATPERLASYERRMPQAVQVTSYGSTECATNLTLPLPGDPYDVRIGTLGTPIEGMEIRIVDPDTREERPTGEVGELAFRGYAQFEGYYKDPAQTAATRDAGGWFYTGDLGTVDAGGRLRYAGRLKDMLKVGGENVAAIEIEDWLARMAGVDLVAVVGAPDGRYGEVPAAFIQRAPGAALTEDEVIARCVGQIATFKVPRYVRFVDEWPMSGTKIQKFRLREQLAAELEAAGVTEAPRVSA